MPQSATAMLGSLLAAPPKPPVGSQLPQNSAPPNMLDQLVDGIMGVVGIGHHGLESKDPTAGGALGETVGLGLPALMGIIKALPKEQSVAALAKLREALKNNLSGSAQDALNVWGYSGHSRPSDFGGLNSIQRKVADVKSNIKDATGLYQALNESFPQNETIPVYRGVWAPTTDVHQQDVTNWLQPRVGPTSWTTDPSVAKGFGDTVLGLQAPKSQVAGTTLAPGFANEREVIVDMNPQLWDQTKVLRTPNTTRDKLAASIAKQSAMPQWATAGAGGNASKWANYSGAAPKPQYSQVGNGTYSLANSNTGEWIHGFNSPADALGAKTKQAFPEGWTVVDTGPINLTTETHSVSDDDSWPKDVNDWSKADLSVLTPEEQHALTTTYKSSVANPGNFWNLQDFAAAKQAGKKQLEPSIYGYDDVPWAKALLKLKNAMYQQYLASGGK